MDNKNKQVKTTTNAENKVKNNTENVKVKCEEVYEFGHNADEKINNSFLVTTMFAHRGLHDETSPENSLSSFKKAIEKGYGIELDVNPSLDGVPMVFHDSKLSRVTGKDKYIQNLTCEELKEITLLNSNETIPTLQEVLELVDGKVPLLIEIKTQEKTGPLEKEVFSLLKNYKGKFAIQSFNPFSLAWFQRKAPKIWRGQLSCFFKGEKLSILTKYMIKGLRTKRISTFDFISYDIKSLPNRYTKKFKNMPILSWSIKSQEQYIKAIQVSDNVIFENFEPKI